MAGLAIGVSSMKSGERALLHVGWELGYGEEGNFSFPNVPPMADLVYEVELIGFDEMKEVSSHYPVQRSKLFIYSSGLVITTVPFSLLFYMFDLVSLF